MTAALLIPWLAARGLAARLDDQGRLRVGPRELVTDEVRELVASCRDELVWELTHALPLWDGRTGWPDEGELDRWEAVYGKVLDRRRA